MCYLCIYLDHKLVLYILFVCFYKWITVLGLFALLQSNLEFKKGVIYIKHVFIHSTMDLIFHGSHRCSFHKLSRCHGNW